MSNRVGIAAAVLLACASTLRAQEPTFYQINLVPSGTLVSTDVPATRGQMVVFHGYPSGTLMSLPRSGVKSFQRIPSASAKASNLAEQVIPIGNLAMQGGASQGGPTNARVIGQAKAAGAAPKENQYGGPGFYNDVIPGQTQAYGNSANDYQVGRTYAYAPSNATQSSPGAPPTAPSMTNGSNPPQ
jgi:hypothetical protein